MTRLEEVKTFTKNISKTTAWLLAVLTAVTVGLLVASFIVPPTGFIDLSAVDFAGKFDFNMDYNADFLAVRGIN